MEIKRLEELDFFRGIAILLVIFCHNLQFGDNSGLPDFLKNGFEAGKYGVQLFYIISGFTIFYSLSNYQSKGGSDSSTRQFLVRRFFRIVPMYYLAIIAYTLITKNYAWSGIALNFSFLHGFSPAYINSIVPGGWSIGVEMLFYLFCPLLFSKIRNLNHAIAFLTLTLLIGFIVRYFLTKFPPDANASNWASFVYFFISNQLPVFALGIALFWAICSKAEINFQRILELVVLILIGLFTGFSILPEHLLVSLFFGLMVYAVFQLPNVQLSTHFWSLALMHIGKISFSLYLVHYACLYLLQRLGVIDQFDKHLLYLHPLISYSARIFLLLLLAIPLAHLFYQVVEKRGMDWGKRFSTRKIAHVSEAN